MNNDENKLYKIIKKNYNIDFNNSYNVIFCIYGFICSFVIILDNTYRSYVMIKEKLY